MANNRLIRFSKILVRQPRIAAGTFVYRAGVLATRKIARQPVVLFVRHGGIGDIICTFPSVLALRARHPDAVFVYSVQQAFKGIVKMGRVADYIVEHDWSEALPKVRFKDYDVAYQPWLEDESPQGRAHVHLVDDFAQTLQVTPVSRQPRLYVSTGLSRALGEKLAPFRRQTKFLFGIHVGPSWPVREWSPAGWTGLVSRLRQNFDCTVFQLGSDVDTARGPVRAPRIPGTEDWVGKLSLEQTAAALAQLDLFIGIDSGLLHAAGAVGTPVVGLFGAINPRLRLPPGTPAISATSEVACLACHHRPPQIHWQTSCEHNIRCMRELSAEKVFASVIQLLAETKPVPRS